MLSRDLRINSLNSRNTTYITTLRLKVVLILPNNHPYYYWTRYLRQQNHHHTVQVEVQLVQSLMNDGNDVVLETYILAYEEINKIFGVLGKVLIQYYSSPKSKWCKCNSEIYEIFAENPKCIYYSGITISKWLTFNSHSYCFFNFFHLHGGRELQNLKVSNFCHN